MISGAHPGLKKGNTPLDQWRVLDVRSNGWEGERSYTGGNSCRESPSGLTPLACGARNRKGLVCVCFLRPHNPDELASKPHVNRLTTASVSTLSPVHSEGLVAMLGP